MGKDFVTFRLRERKGGTQAIFLSFYYKGERHEESLRLFIIPERTTADRKKNEKTWAIAELARARRATELAENLFKLKSEVKDIYLLKFCEEHIDAALTVGTRNNWINCRNKLKDYLGGKDILMRSIDVKFAEGFKKYLFDAKCINFTDGRKLRSNTQWAYYSKFRTLIRDACKNKYMDEDPAAMVVSPRREESERPYLTVEELRRLIATPCPHDVVRQCFLFSCLTGLRRSDIVAMKWESVHQQGTFTRIIFKQKKTKGLQYLDLNDQAAAIMGDRKAGESLVFPKMPTVENTNHFIRTWAAMAGIGKHLSFHSGRHTFATMMLTIGTDLYTVSKLLGHSNISTTQIYAKVLDKSKQDAVSRIPALDI